MGWGNCGKDSKGRPIGYYFEATCDYSVCDEKIDRGLAYACGGMHGEDPGCEGYFCSNHLIPSDECKEFVCPDCVKILEEENV